MSKRLIGFALIVIGAAVSILSLAADPLGLGGAPGIGWKQIIGAVIGIFIVIFGLWLAKAQGKEQPKSGKEESK